MKSLHIQVGIMGPDGKFYEIRPPEIGGWTVESAQEYMKKFTERMPSGYAISVAIKIEDLN